MFWLVSLVLPWFLMSRPDGPDRSDKLPRSAVNSASVGSSRNDPPGGKTSRSSLYLGEACTLPLHQVFKTSVAALTCSIRSELSLRSSRLSLTSSFASSHSQGNSRSGVRCSHSQALAHQRAPETYNSQAHWKPLTSEFPSSGIRSSLFHS